MKPLELGPLLKEKIKHLKTVLFSVAHHDLPFAVPNAVLIVYNPIAIKSSNGRGEQEDHHNDNSDGQLGQEGGIHFSHKLQKGEKKFIHFVIMVYPAVSKFYLGPYLLGGKRGSEAVRHHDLDGSTLSLVVFSHFYGQNYKKV